MSVVASDIVIYSSQNMPQDDSSTAGGAINSGLRVVFEDLNVTGIVEIVSTSGQDTSSITIYGRDNAGSIVNETFALSGTTPVSGSQVFERILTATLDSVATGTISLSGIGNTTGLGNIYPDESGFLRPFYAATANAAGGADKTLYEKVCVKNNNAANALLSTTITEISSGLYNIVKFGVEGVQESTESIANRVAVPTGATFFGDGPSGIPSIDLGVQTWQGLWLQLTLTAGTAAQNSFYQVRVQGSTT
jgi:hypothetical protein